MRFRHILSPDGTLVVLSELEPSWAPRWMPAQRITTGAMARFFNARVPLGELRHLRASKVARK